MEWKIVFYKVAKGAISGAAATLAAMTFVGMPQDKIVPMATAALISGALHGVANALEQVKAG